MDWKDILSKVADTAPVVGSFFGAPGIAVGTAIKAITGAFGLKSDATPEEIINAVSDPDAQIKLLVAKQNYELAIMGADLEKFKTEVDDRKSARQRQSDSEKATGKRDINLYVLAWVIMGGFMGTIMAMLILQYAFGKVLAADPLVTLLLGSLSTDAGMVVGYFFGSSSGSKDKTDILAKTQPIK